VVFSISKRNLLLLFELIVKHRVLINRISENWGSEESLHHSKIEVNYRALQAKSMNTALLTFTYFAASIVSSFCFILAK